jgi:fatty-acyl-CoA synthase
MSVWGRITTEWAYLKGSLRILRRISPIARNPKRTICDVMEEVAREQGDRTALISDAETLTFREYDARANAYCRWAKAQGIGKGDVVALLLHNRPDYLCVWLGVARAGGVTALINTNLTGQGLAHSLAIVKAKIAIVGVDLLPAYRAAQGFLPALPQLWVHGGDAEGVQRLEPARDSHSGAPLTPGERVPLTIEDRCVFIYTSGTTGLPKAANINHYRIQAMALGFSGLMNVQPSDRMYDCLPMYHSNGGVLATCAGLSQGGSVVIREKFSAREFWGDIVRHRCTLFFYIGELCRYLVNAPPGPHDRDHGIRLVCGNGLRPDIWNEFAERFGIHEIREWYAATEGNIAIFNLDSKPGAVGRIPGWAERRFVVKIVRFDIEKEEPIRGADGFCQICAPGEVGEVIGQIINDPAKPANRFEGYADAQATERKILRDVIEKGDAWFRSGDLMKRDADGYFYFIDRIGDTFRWKGENVATSEVSEALGVFPGIDEATVYGVQVPGIDGRAGMAAIVPSVDADVDLVALREHLARQLPEYARPVFLRIRSGLDVTGTFKQRKVDLVREGANPEVLHDPLFFNHPAEKRFVRLDRELYAAICEKRVRL